MGKHSSNQSNKSSREHGMGKNSARANTSIAIGLIKPGEGGYYNMLSDLKKGTVKSQFKGMLEAYEEGQLPPIILQREGDKYVVIDGNHRLAVAVFLNKKRVQAWIPDEGGHNTHQIPINKTTKNTIE